MTTTIELQDTEACVVFQSAGGFEVHIPPTAEDAEIAEDSPTHNAVMVAVLFGDNPASLRLREMVSTLMLDGASPPMTPEPTHQTRSCKVHAEQFWPDVKPWPEGVIYVSKFYGHEFVEAGFNVPIVDGEWLVRSDGQVRVLCNVDFIEEYEPIPPPADAAEDTARLDWIDKQMDCDLAGHGLHVSQVNIEDNQTLRQAIDAARAGGEGT